jgi:hypothetical protein
MKSEQVAVTMGIGILLVAIFLIDVNVPLGFTPWLLYLIPLSLTYWTTAYMAPLVVAGLCTVLLIAGYDLSPPMAPGELALTNRIIGAATFSGLAWLIMRYQLLAQRQSAITEQLKQELTERTQDLGRAVSALRTAGDQASVRRDDSLVVAQEFTRQVTDVLEVERRRLEKKVVSLVGRDQTLDPVNKSLDATLEELLKLKKQLEQWQRDLLA